MASAILLVAFWLRIADLDHYPPGLSFDEAVNVIDGFHIARSGVAPAYEDYAGQQEPVYRPIVAVAMSFFGDRVWTVRLTSVLLNMIAMAGIFWLSQEVLHHQAPAVRRLAGLMALVAFAVLVSNHAISRSTYRANAMLPILIVSAGFILRGLRAGRWRDFALGGGFGGLSLYTYSSAFFYPFALIVLGLSLFALRLKTWRFWLPRMGLAAAVAGIIALPLVILLLTNPEAVLGRVTDVGRDASQIISGQSLHALRVAFFVQGDKNPQYNTAWEPLILPVLQPFFWAGMAVLVWRIRQPASIFAFAILILFTIPALASNQINHALRLFGEHMIAPIIIGAGWVPALIWVNHQPARRQQVLKGAAVAGMSAILSISAITNWQTYRHYWENANNFDNRLMFDVVLNHNEWFFRQDRRDFARWLAAQDAPMLVPIDELNRQTTRAWLLEAYPTVQTAHEAIAVPQDAQVVVPYSLELGRLMDQERHYALMHEGTITLLPPFNADSHASLIANIQRGDPITRAGDEITFLGYTKPISDNFAVQSPRYHSQPDSTPLATFGEDALSVIGWYGSDVLTAGEQEFTLVWQAHDTLYHDYVAFLQIQTQAFERLVGDDVPILRWLHPSTMWQPSQRVPDAHKLVIPSDLVPGAYRLAAGLYTEGWPAIAARSHISETIDQSATIGWLKVPQQERMTIPTTAVEIDAVFNHTSRYPFRLSHAEFVPLPDGQLLAHLYWESQIDRPTLDATVFVHLVSAQGEIVAQDDARPWNGQYPTFIWDAGEIVRTAHVLQLPSATQVQALSVRVGMYTFPGPQNLSVEYAGRAFDDGLLTLGMLREWLIMDE